MRVEPDPLRLLVSKQGQLLDLTQMSDGERSLLAMMIDLCRRLVLANPELDASFLTEAKQAGLVGLKGHKSVGGMRASIYNAVPLESVRVLVDFMNDFARRNG